MRILIKGGVWKNTEDEILKAAVMKYGNNQWSRVASLMNRKSAKQCKARWYEWLDPSIKKTEWTREEEEKLLHLAKLMPNQWRSIAPIIGRTAGQCIEHYERLLDQAQEDAEERQGDDARRLRPGEIDPAPETKPARPDPVDMDDDELEMLAEARARLANTKGKKAKRKMRERMLEESRRLAMLQKRRELKAAGINTALTGRGSKKRKFVDYTKEIPFQKIAPAGFYDVSEEDQAAKRMSLDPVAHGLELNKMEGRHAKEEEEAARKRDGRFMKKLFEENAPLAVMKASQENDPAALRRRLPLSLPSPQVTEDDLEDIVKLSKATAQSMAPPEGLPSGFRATQALVADYSHANQPSATPMRTPHREDVILQEAKNLRALRDMTPLMTQELPELYEGTGFAGVTPRHAVAMTPNLLASRTPSRGGAGSHPSQTPSTQSVAGSVAGSVASYRDQFGLNMAQSSRMDAFDGESSILSRPHGKHDFALQQHLRAKLQGLSEPEYSYEVSVPQVETVEDEEEDLLRGQPEDAADLAEKRLRAEQAARDLQLAKRSSALKRDLPRPLSVDASLAQASFDSSSHPAELVRASAMINEEMVRLVLHEIQLYPPENVKPQALAAAQHVHWEDLSLSDVQAAEELILQELASIPALQEKLEKTITELEAQHKDLQLQPNGHWKASLSNREVAEALKHEFHTLQSIHERERKRMEKVGSKYTVLTQGYVNKEKEYRAVLQDTIQQYNSSSAELEGLWIVRDQEARAAEHRIMRLKEEVKVAEAAEAESQATYARLVDYARQCGIAL